MTEQPRMSDRGRAPRLAFDFTDEGRVSERCSACQAPCETPERTDG